MLFQSERKSGAKLRKADYLLHIIWNRNITSDWCASLKSISTGGPGMGFLKTSCYQLEVLWWLIFPLSELGIFPTKQSGKETAVQTVWCLGTANYISTGCSNLISISVLWMQIVWLYLIKSQKIKISLNLAKAFTALLKVLFSHENVCQDCCAHENFVT